MSTLYSNTDLSRSLFLTKEYLFDVYQLADTTKAPRDFYWLVHAPGSAVPESGQSWQPSDQLQKTLFATKWQGVPQDRSTLPPAQRNYHLVTEGTDGPPWVKITNAKMLAPTDGPVSVTTIQDYHGEDLAHSQFGEARYNRKIGVRVSMLPAAGTTAWTFDTPEAYTPGSPRTTDDKGHRAIGAEWGGVSIAIHRKAPATVFAALHEPYEGGKANETSFTPIQQTANALGVWVVGLTAKGGSFNDRLLLQFDTRPEAAVKAIPELEKDPAVEPVTLAGKGESYTFKGHAVVRVTVGHVEVTGDVSALRCKVDGPTTLVVNGQDQLGKVEGGMLDWKR